MSKVRQRSRRKKKHRWLAIMLTITLIFELAPVWRTPASAEDQQENSQITDTQKPPAEGSDPAPTDPATPEPTAPEPEPTDPTPPDPAPIEPAAPESAPQDPAQPDPVTPPAEEPVPVKPVPADPASQIIIRYKNQTSSIKTMRALNSEDVKSISQSAQGLQLIQVSPGANLEETLASLRKDVNIEYAEPNYILKGQWIDENLEPTDANYSDQWALQSNQLDTIYAWASGLNSLFSRATVTSDDGTQSNIYDKNGDLILGPEDDWKGLYEKASDVTVAVLDTGVDASHEDLSGKILSGYNAITKGTDQQTPGSSMDDSENGHGTHVAGIIAALPNNDPDGDGTAIGITGITGDYPVHVLPIKVLDSSGVGTVYDISQGIRWAVDQGARIINLSLGARLPDYPKTLADAVQYAQDRGALVVAAAGNDGKWVEGFYPASLPGVISVGATQMNHHPAPFSNGGAMIQAPGEDIWSTLPGNQYGKLSGSSQATAYVSGAAALYHSIYPDRSMEKVAQALDQGETDYPEGCRYEWWGTICDAHYYVLDMPKMLDKDDLPWNWIEFIEPPQYGRNEVRLTGQSTMTVKVHNVANTKRIVFKLGESRWDQKAVLLKEVDVDKGDIIPESGLYTFNWDTSQHQDGKYTVIATIYYADDEYIYDDYADLDVVIANESTSNGLTIQVEKPDGTPASRAWVTVHHPFVKHSDYVPSSYIEYEYIWDGQADMQGKVVLSGVDAADGNDYLITARGSEPNFFYYQIVRPPGTVNLNAEDAQKVTISGQHTDQAPLKNALFWFDLLEGNLPTAVNPDQTIHVDTDLDPLPLTTLNTAGTAEVYMTPGKYNLRLIQEEDHYYLKKQNFELTKQTNGIEFHPKESEVAKIKLAPEGNATRSDFLLEDETSEWSIGFHDIPSDRVVTVTPGSYSAQIHAVYPGNDGKEYVWSLDTPVFQTTAGQEHPLRFGPPLSGTIQIFPELYPKGYWEKGHTAFLEVQFPDAFGNRTTGLQTQPLGTQAIRGIMVQSISQAEQKEPIKTYTYNVQNKDFELYQQELTRVIPTLEIYDPQGTPVIEGRKSIYLDYGFGSTWSNSYWDIPLNAADGTYTAVAKLASGPLSGSDTGVTASPSLPLSGSDTGVTASPSLPFEIRSGQQEPPPPSGQPDLTVTVLDRAGNPMPNAKVSVVKRNGNVYEEIKGSNSDANGKAMFSELSLDPKGTYGVVTVGRSLNPDQPDNPAETVMWLTPLSYGEPPLAITASAKEQPMQRVVLHPLDQNGDPLAGEKGYAVFGYDKDGIPFEEEFKNTSDLTVWLPAGEYTFQAFINKLGGGWNDGQTELPPLYYLTAKASLSAENEMIILGGPGLAELNVNGPTSEGSKVEYYVPNMTLFNGDVPLSPTYFLQIVDSQYDYEADQETEFIKKRKLFVSPGSYRAQAALVHRHFDGNWDFWLEKDLTLTAGLPVKWEMDDQFQSSLATGQKNYGIADTIKFTHDIRDSFHNRLVAAAIGLQLEENGYGGESVPASPIEAQNHEEVAPFLSIYKADGTEVSHVKEAGDNYALLKERFGQWYYDTNQNLFPMLQGGSTFFGGSFLIPEDLEGGVYQAKLEFGNGPHTFVPSETAFTIQAAPGVPVLETVVSPTNAASVNVTGRSLPGAEVSVYSSRNGGVEALAGTITADAETGSFQLSVTLPEEGSYALTATASSNGMTSGTSAPITVVVDRTPSGAPVGLQGSALDESHVRLSWNAPLEEPIARYEIKRNGVVIVNEITGGQTLTYQDSGLAKQTEYSYEVTAIDLAGNRSQPAAVSVRTSTGSDSEPPTPPLHLQAAVEKNTVKLTWGEASDNIGVVSYRIYRDAGTEPVGTVQAAAELTFTDKGLSYNTAYAYKVTAVDEAGNESAKDAAVISATTGNLAIASIRWHGEKDSNGFLAPGKDLKFILIGDKEVQASAVAEFVSQDESGNGIKNTAEAILTEDKDAEGRGMGIYRGSLAVPAGVSKVISITGKLGDGKGYSVSQNVEGLPVSFSGMLAVTVEAEDHEALHGAQLIAWSDALKTGNKVVMDGPGHYTIQGLSPGNDYVLSIITSDNLVLEKVSNIAVKSGVPSSVTMNPALPALLDIRAVDNAGEPVQGMEVIVSSADGTSLVQGVSGSDGWVRRPWNTSDRQPILATQLSGTELKISAQIPYSLREKYMPGESIATKLEPGMNQATVTVTKRPTATLEGVISIKDESELVDANVTAYQVIEGVTVTRTTKTDENGHYQLDLLAGPVKLVITHRHTGSKEVTLNPPLQAGENRTWNIPISIQGAITLHVYTQRIDEPEYKMDMDWRTAVHLHVRGRNLGHEGKEKNTSFSIWGEYDAIKIPDADPGDVIEITADGYEAKMTNETVTVTLDENSWGRAEVRLKEKGQIGAIVRDVHGESNDGSERWVEVFKDTGEKLEKVNSFSSKNSNLTTGQLDEGTYTLVYHWGALPPLSNNNATWQYPRRSYEDLLQYLGKNAVIKEKVVVQNAKQTDLGPIALPKQEPVQPGYFRGQEGNDFTASKYETSPGSVITMRASYQYAGGQDSPKSLKLFFGIPENAELIENSIVVKSVKGPADPVAVLKSGHLEMDLGDAAAEGIEGTVLYSVKMDDNSDWPTAAAESWAEFTVNGKQMGEEIGSAVIQIQHVTLSAPEQIWVREIPVSGRAPAGAAVKIYDGSYYLAETTASANGVWKMTVVLPDRGRKASHWLRAEVVAPDVLAKTVEVDPSILSSAAQRVNLDPDKPRIDSATMKQSDGREMTFAPVGKFPYVLVPGMGFNFKVNFNDPSRITNLSLHADNGAKAGGGTALPNQSFAGTLNGSRTVPGKIYASYDILPKAWSMAATAPTEAVIRSGMPSAFRDAAFQKIDYDDGDPNTREAKAELLLGGNPDMKIHSTVVVTNLPNFVPNESIPTGQPPAYNFEMSVSEVGGQLHYSIKAIIPDSSIVTPGQMSAQGIETPAKLVWIFGETAIHGAFSISDLYGALSGANDYNNFLEKLDDLQDYVNSSCDPYWVQTYSERIQEMRDRLKFNFVASNIVSLSFTGIGALAGFGIGGTIGMALANTVITSMITYNDENLYNIMKDGIYENIQCKSEEERKKRVEELLADPTWILDPSGYVYEAVPENRLEDVTATALQKVDNEWQTWDAAWFEQQNPLVTDSNGRYAWDVPEGLWQVLYQKLGYETARSAELPVPPPQTEVNIGMVSYAAPQVTAIQAKASDNRIEITFDKYMRVETVGSASIKVSVPGQTDEFGDPVYAAGSLEPVHPQADPNHPGVQLTRVFRFIPDTPIAEGEEYTVWVSQMVQSYAERTMAEDYQQTVQVVPGEINEVSHVKVTAGERMLKVAWEDPQDLSFSHILVSWGKTGSGEFGEPVKVNKGISEYTISDLENGVVYEIKITTVSQGGTSSDGVVVRGTPVKPAEPHHGSGGKGSDPVPSPGEQIIKVGSGPQKAVAFHGELTLKIPDGALKPGTTLVLRKITGPVTVGTEMTLHSPLYSIGGAVPSKPIMLKMKYSPLSTKGVDLRKLAIYRQNESNAAVWEYQGGAIEAESGVIAVSIGGPGLYSAMTYDHTFADLSGHWSKNDVEVLISRHIIQGINAQQFQPDRNITRAEIAKLLVELVESDLAESQVATFTDVAPDQWYYSYVQKAAAYGLVKGNKGQFRPNDPVTREEISVMIYRLLEQQKSELKVDRLPYKDSNLISDWALDSIKLLHELNLMKGMTDNQFAPKALATRAQAAVVVLRMMEQLGF